MPSRAASGCSLLVQGHTDHPFFQAAARALYRDLLAAGVEIHEYQASELHAKVAVVDGHWATVGSSNIDPFSLLLAREANIVVENHAFASDLRRRLQQAGCGELAAPGLATSGTVLAGLWRGAHHAGPGRVPALGVSGDSHFRLCTSRRSSWRAKACRSPCDKDDGPDSVTPAPRRPSIRLRIASRSWMLSAS
jgi:hypothetical protein